MTDLRILMTVEEAADALRIGRTRMFALIASGEIESVLIGRSRRISVDALREYARNLSQDVA
jgi:excisionase family DNA binding protein